MPVVVIGARRTRPGDLPLSGEQRPHPPRARAPDRPTPGTAAASWSRSRSPWRCSRSWGSSCCGGCSWTRSPVSRWRTRRSRAPGTARTRLWRVAEPRARRRVRRVHRRASCSRRWSSPTVRRRWSLAVQVAVLMVGANLTHAGAQARACSTAPTSASRPTTATPCPAGTRPRRPPSSAALLFVVPPRARPWAAVLGAGYTTATGVSTLVGQWHRPGGRRRGRPRGARVDRDRVRDGAPLTGPRGASTATGALRRRRAGPTADAGRPCAGAVAVRCVIVGVLGGGLRRRRRRCSHTWQNLADLRRPRGRSVTAYFGGAAGVLMASCLAFAIMLRAAPGAPASRLPRG